MNLVSSAKARYETLRSIAYTGISGTYAIVGTPFENPVRVLKVNNFTDANMIISFNGVDDMDVVAANSAYVLDFCTNKSEKAGLLEQPAGNGLYVKKESASPSKDNFYVTVIYASQV